MSPQILSVLIVVAIFAYELFMVNTRIRCIFTGRDKKIKKKWAKPTNGERIEFNNGWYYVVTHCITYDTALFGLLPVAVLNFTWRNKYPIDPATGDVATETPEMRKNLDKREDIQAYNEGGRVAIGKTKVGFMGGGILPIILVVGVVASVYFIFQMRGQIDMLGQAINVLQEMIMKK